MATSGTAMGRGQKKEACEDSCNVFESRLIQQLPTLPRSYTPTAASLLGTYPSPRPPSRAPAAGFVPSPRAPPAASGRPARRNRPHARPFDQFRGLDRISCSLTPPLAAAAPFPFFPHPKSPAPRRAVKMASLRSPTPAARCRRASRTFPRVMGDNRIPFPRPSSCNPPLGRRAPRGTHGEGEAPGSDTDRPSAEVACMPGRTRKRAALGRAESPSRCEKADFVLQNAPTVAPMLPNAPR